MKPIVIIFLILTPYLASSQQHIQKKHKAFYPYISLNYNIQNIPYPDPNISIFNPVKYRSNFFGSEFGFSILPRNKTGLFFSYNNKLMAELGIKEIYKLFKSEVGDNITDYTISSGYFGSLDIGKQVYNDNHAQMIAGIRIADKYISGINPLLQTPHFIEYEYEGFHLTPGIYGEYKRKLGRDYSLAAKLALSQSVLNFWTFAQNGDDFNFRHPFFTDLSVQVLHKSGIYLKAENTTMFSYGDNDPYYRLSFGLGYRF